MKTSPYFLLIMNAFLAIGLTVISFQYVQPKHCYNFCDPSYVIPCPKGSCYFGEQKAGWPIPAFVDAPGGGSPTGGWGLLGPEDPPLPLPMIGDVLFYSIIVWIVLDVIQFFRHRALRLKPFLTSLPLNAFLGVALWVFYFIFTFTVGVQVIGRGYRDSVYVQTSKDVDLRTAMVFSPRVSVPLDEVIEYYGTQIMYGLLLKAPPKVQQLVCYFIGIRSICSLNFPALDLKPILSKERPLSKGSFITTTRLLLL
jgi:hypothetical protein